MLLAFQWAKITSHLDWLTQGIGVLVAIGAIFYAHRSWRAGQDAAKSARDSADASKDSAESARRAAAAAEELTRIEGDRDHDLMAPMFDASEFFWKMNDRTGLRSLFCRISSSSLRDYDVGGWMIDAAKSRKQLAPFTLRAGRREEIYIGLEGMAIPEEIALAFDGPECPCQGRRAEGDGHWLRTVAVPDSSITTP